MNPLTEYALKQTEDAVHWLNGYEKNSDGEALHQCRVSIKKIRSVIGLLEGLQLHKRKVKKRKQQLQQIFHSAGFIREAELQVQWLKKNRCSVLLQEASLENKLPVYKNIFLDEAGRNRKALHKIGKELAALCKAVDERSVFEYTTGLKQSVVHSIQSVNRDGWHSLRKSIKQLLYAYSWQKENEKIRLLTVKEYTYFDELQEAIGTWHDAEDLKTWLSDEQFFLNSSSKVKTQFNQCWEILLNEISRKEEGIKKLIKNKPGSKTKTA